MWKGAAPSLNAMPATTNTRPKTAQHAVGLAALDRVGHARELEGTRGAVDHGQAVEQQSRGERAQHEVLHRGLGGAGGIALQGHHRVLGERHQLEAEVEREEVVRRDHHHHPERAEEREAEELAGEEVAHLQVRAAHRQAGDHGDEGGDLQHLRQHVGHVQAVEGDLGRAAELARRDDGGHEERRLGEPVGGLAILGLDEQVRHEERGGEHQEGDLRESGRHGGEREGGGGHGYRTLDVSACCCSCRMVGLATSASGFG